MKKPTNARKPEIADTLKQAAGMLGTDIATLRAAKNAGCPGFVNSRVNLELVRQWLKDTPTQAEDTGDLPPKEKLERLKLKAQVQGITFKNSVEEKRFVAVSEVHGDMTRIGNAIRTQLMTLKQVAPGWSGLDSCEIDKRVDGFIRECCERFNDLSGPLYKEAK